MAIRREANPWLYALNVERHRTLHSVKRFLFTRVARGKRKENFPVKIMSHRSVLMRKLGNADMRLQLNKITNLRLAAKEIDGVVIQPGETFSLWKLVGKPTAERGFVSGMLLSEGKIIEGVGGGLCQMANLLYWMVLHSPLTVTARYRHSYDVFPDSGRVLPFGSGATIFYNYVDFAFRNDTKQPWQIRVWVTDEHLEGELRAMFEWPYSYRIIEKDHAFYRDGRGKWRRKNELYKRITDKRTGRVIGEDLVTKNDSLVLYEPTEVIRNS